MPNQPRNIVTGAYGFSGRYITELLLADGESVKTLTGHPDRPNPFGDRIEVGKLDFDNRQGLLDAMRGAATLFNTYWIRFPHGGMTFERAAENSRTLVRAAVDAGIQRIVHISITNPSKDAPSAYFRGKAVVEEEIVNSGIPYAILRPAVLFGDGGILINTIAWMLRRFPLIPVMGDGNYKTQPVFVGDLARLAVDASRMDQNTIIDAVGPEIFTYNELVTAIGEKIGRRARLIYLPPMLGYYGSRTLGFMLRDVILTRDEIRSLMANYLVSSKPATATTLLTDWVAENADTLGRKYISELDAHYRKQE